MLRRLMLFALPALVLAVPPVRAQDLTARPQFPATRPYFQSESEKFRDIVARTGIRLDP